MATAAGRDEGLRRVSHLTAWLAAGALGLVGVLSAVAARATPGRSSSAQSIPTSGNGDSAAVPEPEPPTTTTTTTPPSTSRAGGVAVSPTITVPRVTTTVPSLVPPVQAPRPGRGRGSVRSGAS